MTTVAQGCYRSAIAGVVAVLALAGCAAPSGPAEPIEWSSEWFSCEHRFQCVAVYDAFCRHTGVNLDYLGVYQDWARQQVEKSGEHVPCPPAERADEPLRAYCRDSVCRYP